MAEWLSTLIIVLVGSALTLIGGWASDRRAARRDRESREEARRDALRFRRDDFQRQTLLALQDAGMRLLRCTAAVMHQNLKSRPVTRNTEGQDIISESNDGFMVSTEELRLLSTRVLDETTRGLANEFRKRCATAVRSYEVEAVLENVISMTDAHRALNDRAGELIRNLDGID